MDGTTILDTDFVPVPLWKRTQALMEIALQSGKFNTKQLQQINAVGVNLRVVFLSEICNAQATHLRVGLAEGTADQLHVSNARDNGNN